MHSSTHSSQMKAGNELADFVLALAAERAVERVLGVAAADLAHLVSPSASRRPAKPITLQKSISGGLLRVRSSNVTYLRRVRAGNSS
jgi:hypothetical protein